MFSSILAADPAPTWLALVIAGGGGIFGGAGLWGFLQGRLARRDTRADNAVTERKAAATAGATVEIANINSFQDLQEQRRRDNAALHGEINALRERTDKQIGKFERKLQATTNYNSRLYSVTLLLHQNWRMLRARLKRTDKEFDPEEFPEIDIKEVDPKQLYDELQAIDRDVTIHVFPSPSDPGKSTTITTSEDGDVRVI